MPDESKRKVRLRFEGKEWILEISESLPVGILETSVFKNWIRRLRDKRAQSIINRRLFLTRCGTFGAERDLKDGVWELKIDYGPGYRIYYGKYGKQVIVLVAGGDKEDQNESIHRAKALWKEIQNGGIEQL